MYPDMEERLHVLEQRLGVTFKNRKLLLTAVTHPSYLNEHPEATWGHNQILEFLGDAVLELCVTDHLVSRFPNETEGVLSVKRVAIVCGETLSVIGEEMQLSRVILLSRGELKDHTIGSKSRKYILACTVEAILGALYQDQGIGECRLIVDHFFHTRITQLVQERVDIKSILQERIQRELGVTPRYEVLSMTGSHHARRFVMAVYAGNTRLAFGEGSSKKEAERNAASSALESLPTPTK